MTFTEKTMVILIVAAIIILPLGGFMWIVSLLLLATVAYIAINSAFSLSNDPPFAGLRSVFGTPTTHYLPEPRFVFAYPNWPLVEEIIPIPKSSFNWDFTFTEVECNSDDIPAGQEDYTFELGGKATVEISYTGGLVHDAEHAYQFVLQGREAGIRDIFEDKLNSRVRTHALRKSLPTFVGEKKPFSVIINGYIGEIIAGLGLEAGTLTVKKIKGEGRYGELMGDKAVEKFQKVIEGIDMDTRLDNAEKIFDRFVAKGDTTITMDRAMEIERIERGRAENLVISSNDTEKKKGSVGPAVARVLNHHGDHHEQNDDHDTTTSNEEEDEHSSAGQDDDHDGH